MREKYVAKFSVGELVVPRPEMQFGNKNYLERGGSNCYCGLIQNGFHVVIDSRIVMGSKCTELINPSGQRCLLFEEELQLP